MSVLITGATGFVGSWLMETAKCETIGTNHEFILEGNWNTVIHTAISHDVKIDIYMAQKVLEAARLRGAKTVFISSGAAATSDYDSYSILKRGLEASFDLVYRLYAPLGPRMKDFAPFHMMKNALDGRFIDVYNPTHVRAYIYAEDMANAMWAGLTRGATGRVDVTGKIPYTISDLAREVSKQTGAPISWRGEVAAPRAYYGIIPNGGMDSKPLSEMVSLTLESMK
jgi:uncharacterized protein YbjT (DUF2867 family)